MSSQSFSIECTLVADAENPSAAHRGWARSRSRFVAAALCAAVVATTGQAAAVGEEAASVTAKGATGGALLGAEVVLLTEALIGVENRWYYLAGGLIGAAGGGVGGYFLEDSISAKAGMWMVASGMVLAIPTTVAVLNATAYRPPADYVQDTAPADEPPAEPPQAPEIIEEARLDSSTRILDVGAPLPPLVSLDLTSAGALSWGVPAVAVFDRYSAEERLIYGMAQETELRLPVMSMHF